MKKILKRFEEWVTGLRSNIFTWARISITALYLLIILGVLTVYSVAMYFSLLKNITEQIITVSNNSNVSHDLLDHAIDNLQLKIFLIDLGTFIVAAWGSYWLAGVTLRPIKRALEAQEAFSADASHELRTPLAVMKTDIEVLLRGKTPLAPEVTNVLKSNLEEITLLSTMTGELLELARGKRAAYESVVIAELVGEEIKKLQNLATQKSITLTLLAETAADIVVERQAIARVIKNVIANALEYTLPQGLVSVSVEEAAHTIIISIVDNGIGISTENLTHVFERFYKADTARVSTIGGSGLGLAISKDLVEHYGGSIAITSELKKGTTVTITFPKS